MTEGPSGLTEDPSDLYNFDRCILTGGFFTGDRSNSNYRSYIYLANAGGHVAACHVIAAACNKLRLISRRGREEGQSHA